MLMAVLNCLFDSLSQMLRYVFAAVIYKHTNFFKALFFFTKINVYIFNCRKNVERRALLENMEGLFLAVDEIVDGG